MQRTTKSGPQDSTVARSTARRKSAPRVDEARSIDSPSPSRAATTKTAAAKADAVKTGTRKTGIAGVDASHLDARQRSRRIAERARARVETEGHSPATRKVAVTRVRASEQVQDGVETPQQSPKHRKSHNPFRRANLVTMIVAVVAGVVGLGLLVMIAMAQKDYNSWQAQVEFREKQLAALDEQHDVGKRRLAALASPKGRDQLLVEHGYLHPGDRILLFPATPAEKQAADIPKNDLSPHLLSPQDGSADPNASIWKRTADTFRSWWNSGH